MLANAQDPEYLERQYNIRAAIPEHPAIFARYAERSRRTRNTERCELDVRYGNSSDETVDIFHAHGTSRALLLFIHGGYWRALDKSDFSFVADALAPAGVTVAVVNYSLCPKVHVADIVRQMRQATAWLWRNAGEFGAPADSLYVSGHSAGAHLTAMMLATDWAAVAPDVPSDFIKGALAVSGLYELEPLRSTSMNADIRLTEKDIAECSPARLQPWMKAPLYLSFGGLESDEFKRHTRLLADWWSDLGCIHIPMPNVNHLVVIEELANPQSALCKGALGMMGLTT
ncbi:MAG: alpha/beta hydrolase [Candidatus Binatia bacterium]